MRHISLVFAAFLFSGCAANEVSKVQAVQESVAFDFSDYSEKGFLITPQRYNGDYESVGQITLTLWPRAERKHNNGMAERLASDDSSVRAQGEWMVYYLQTDDLIDAAYQKASEMGADAIVSFSVTPQRRQITPRFTLTGYEVTGFAIDRTAKE
jgi:hypothetical protein